MADILNVSVKTVSHWQSGYSEPSLDLLIKLKNALDVTYKELLEDKLI